MARGINKVILVGNLGADPDTRYMPSGGAVTNLSVATSESWKDKQTGEQKERKGSQVYIEGSLQTRKWQDKDGNDRYTTEIKAREMQMLGGRGGGGSMQDTGSYSQPGAPSRAAEPADDFDDDIPF